MAEDYQDIDGNPTPLEKLVRQEPDWAVSRLRVMRSQITDHRAEIDSLRAEVKARREQIEVLVECLHQEGVSLADPWMQTPWTESKGGSGDV